MQKHSRALKTFAMQFKQRGAVNNVIEQEVQGRVQGPFAGAGMIVCGPKLWYKNSRDFVYGSGWFIQMKTYILNVQN